MKYPPNTRPANIPETIKPFIWAFSLSGGVETNFARLEEQWWRVILRVVNLHSTARRIFFAIITDFPKKKEILFHENWSDAQSPSIEFFRMSRNIPPKTILNDPATVSRLAGANVAKIIAREDNF